MLDEKMTCAVKALRSYAEDAVSDLAQCVMDDPADPRVRALRKKGLRGYDLQSALADELFNSEDDMLDLLADRLGDAINGSGAWGSRERKQAWDEATAIVARSLPHLKGFDEKLKALVV